MEGFRAQNTWSKHHRLDAAPGCFVLLWFCVVFVCLLFRWLAHLVTTGALEVFRMPLLVPNGDIWPFDWLAAAVAQELLGVEVITLAIGPSVNWEKLGCNHLLTDL